MLRFLPDTWTEGWLRPFILLDPVGYIYFELPAPDARLAAIAVLGLMAIFWGRMRRSMDAAAWRTLGAFALIFYLWVFITGNGRYFMAGLLVAGPLLARLILQLPVAVLTRSFVLLLACAAQLWQVTLHFSPGQWSKAFWSDGNGLPLLDPQPQGPAVFLTISNLTHSIIAPQFHPDSIWINLIGQATLKPGMQEYERFLTRASSEMPKYLIISASPETTADTRAPEQALQDLAQRSLMRYGLSAKLESCNWLPSHLRMKSLARAEWQTAPVLSFWACPVEGQPARGPTVAALSRWEAVYSQIEKRCPRFFPPGAGEDLLDLGLISSRAYLVADTRLFVDGERRVLFRYSRALNPTFIGSVEQVLAGQFEIPCAKLPGRYQFPWNRD